MQLEYEYGIEIKDTEELERADTLAEFVALCKKQTKRASIL